MKLSMIILDYWTLCYVLAAGINLEFSMAVQSRHLHRRTLTINSQSKKQEPARPPRLKGSVSADTRSRFQGSTFIKNELGKHTITGPDGTYQGVGSYKKVSAGGTQNHRGKLAVGVSGPNVGVKLHVPKGSIGSYYTKTDTEKVHHFVEHKDSPFRWDVPSKQDGSLVSARAEIHGPGSVKAKAWN